MSDFILSINKITDDDSIKNAIQSIYQEDEPKVNIYHGEWGSLGISENLYNGFQPYENEQFIVVVIGGPILMFRDNNFINHKNSFEGTKAIYERWKNSEMRWEKDLSGPFVVLIVDKEYNYITCITDMMSFIPVYLYNTSEEIFIGTHVDIVAKISEQSKNIDIISNLDFILHGVVTYPYTTYRNIFQIAPASEHKIKNCKLKSKNYWFPYETVIESSIDETAKYLRESLQNYVYKIVLVSTNIAQFISGGEDSRTLTALLQEHTRDAYIFLDNMNREGKIAKKVLQKYGGNFKLTTREKLHYLNILPSCSRLVGSGSQYHHAHTYGFHKSCNLQLYTAVFGGLLADALLKGSHIKKIPRTGQLPFIPEIKQENYSAANELINPLFNIESLSELSNRRKRHLEYIKSFRNESAEEWFELWPSSMNMNIPNIHANRRLFRSYEPFTSNEVVKISASVPQKWKLNRRLFHKMAKPLLEPTKWIQHGDGWYPYYSWPLKSIIAPITKTFRRVGRKLGIYTGNQGPWGDWHYMMSSDKWFSYIEEYGDGIKVLFPALNEKDLMNIIKTDKINFLQKINLLQTLYTISKINNVK